MAGPRHPTAPEARGILDNGHVVTKRGQVVDRQMDEDGKEVVLQACGFLGGARGGVILLAAGHNARAGDVPAQGDSHSRRACYLQVEEDGERDMLVDTTMTACAEALELHDQDVGCLVEGELFVGPVGSASRQRRG